jgi:putative cell wall-binding protein
MRLRTKTVLATALALVMLTAMAGAAIAAPIIARGIGIEASPHSISFGLCTNCHTFAVSPTPAITLPVTPPHGNRGTNCAGCHKINTTTPPPRVAVTYVKGVSRYETAIKVSQKMYPAGAPAVVLATGVNFPDALCAAPLAKSYGGPILLVAPGSALSASLLTEVTRLHPATIMIIGSGSAVSTGIEAQVKALSWAPTVTRIFGAGRYSTAAAVADVLKARLGTVDKVVIANGTNYPDALAAAPLAAAKGWPILLTRTSALPPETAAAVTRMGATSSLIAGSVGAVDAGVAALLPSPLRKGGANRYETCALIVDYAVSLGMKYTYLGLTVGNNFPDALAAGPMFAQKNGVLMLTPPTGVPTAISTRVVANKAAVTSFVVVGGAVPAPCVTAMNGFLQ